MEMIPKILKVKTMEFDKNKHLKNVLESYKMYHVQNKMEKYIEKRENIKDELDLKYSTKKVTRAINSGSNAKHTPINSKFDIDICLPFKKDSFETLEKMSDDVFNFFMNEYEDEQLVKYKTKKQRVSVGLTFLIDGEEIGMDIVPGRELNEDDYKESHRLNLYVRAKGIDPATSTQTNIQKHIDLISGKSEEREIIKLLKIWNISKNNGKKLKSFLIELITIRAFDDYNKEEKLNSIWDRLKMTIEFIKDNIEAIQLKDPANSNNIVSNTLTAIEKKNLSLDMKLLLDRISDSGNNLKIYFPINDKYEPEEQESKIGASILSTKSFS